MTELLTAFLVALAAAPAYRAWREAGHPTLGEL